jgi:hypothetical protein
MKNTRYRYRSTAHLDDWTSPNVHLLLKVDIYDMKSGNTLSTTYIEKQKPRILTVEYYNNNWVKCLKTLGR